MNVEVLSRIQFGATIAFHYLFPPLSIGLGLVANTNVGGDNCHRGALLGAILGAALGYAAIPKRWIQGLRSRAELEEEIESFAARFA